MADSVSDLLNRADESVQDGDLRGALICYDHILWIRKKPNVRAILIACDTIIIRV